MFRIKDVKVQVMIGSYAPSMFWPMVLLQN